MAIKGSILHENLHEATIAQHFRVSQFLAELKNLDFEN